MPAAEALNRFIFWRVSARWEAGMGPAMAPAPSTGRSPGQFRKSIYIRRIRPIWPGHFMNRGGFSMQRLLASLLILCGLGSTVIPAEPPGLMHYQGRLTDSAGNPQHGSMQATFTFWDTPDAGHQIGTFSD